MICRAAVVCVALAAGARWVAPAAAQVVVYDNGAPDPGGWSNGAHPLTDTVQAEDFTLTGPASIAGLRFYGLEHRGGYAGSIDWSIRPDDGGKPAATALAGALTGNVTRTPTDIIRADYRNAPLSLYSIDTGDVALGPGTYWLVLHNGPPTLTTADNAQRFFLWESTSELHGPTGAEDPAPFEGAWQPTSTTRERSFSLVTVPEPSGALPALLPLFWVTLSRVRVR